MSTILLLSDGSPNPALVFPQLELLCHKTELSPAVLTPEANYSAYDLAVIDGRKNLSKSQALSRALAARCRSLPVIVLANEGGLAAISANWSFDDVIVDTASPAETDARIRLALARAALRSAKSSGSKISASGVVIDENSYSVKVGGEILNLTYKEFELLKYLAQNPGHVFSRGQLLEHVWGYDYYGGTRTVDVHIRRLRSKLGVDHEYLIDTVRNVGYKFKASAGNST